MLENITIYQGSDLAQIIAGANIETYLTELANWLIKKRVFCTFLAGRNISLEKYEIKGGGKIETFKRVFKLPSYCFEGANNVIKFALIETYVIKRVNGCKCFK